MFGNQAYPSVVGSKCNLFLYIVHNIAMAVSFPTAHFIANRPTLDAARVRLSDVLNHPAFSAERRQKAERMMMTTSDAHQVCQWATLALEESERWEDAVLAGEESQAGPPAYPPYPY